MAAAGLANPLRVTTAAVATASAKIFMDFLLIERADRPRRTLSSFSNKRFHNRSWLNHLSYVHISLTASVVQCILAGVIVLIPKFAAFRETFVCGLWNPKASKLMNELKVAHAA